MKTDTHGEWGHGHATRTHTVGCGVAMPNYSLKLEIVVCQWPLADPIAEMTKQMLGHKDTKSWMLNPAAVGHNHQSTCNPYF